MINIYIVWFVQWRSLLTTTFSGNKM